MLQRVPDVPPLRGAWPERSRRVPVVQIVCRNQIKEEAIRRFGNSRKDRRYLHWVFSKQGNGSTALGYSVEVVAPERGLSVRGTSDDKLFSGDVVRKLLVQMEQQADLSPPAQRLPQEPSVAVKVRERASRRAVKQALDEDRGRSPCVPGRRAIGGLVQPACGGVDAAVRPPRSGETAAHPRYDSRGSGLRDRDVRV